MTGVLPNQERVHVTVFFHARSFDLNYFVLQVLIFMRIVFTMYYNMDFNIKNTLLLLHFYYVQIFVIWY